MFIIFGALGPYQKFYEPFGILIRIFCYFVIVCKPVADDFDVMEVVHVGSVKTYDAFANEIFGILLRCVSVKSGQRAVVALDHDTSFNKAHELSV